MSSHACGASLRLSEGHWYDHPYSVQRTQKLLSGETEGLRPSKLVPGSYSVRVVMDTKQRRPFWLLLDNGKWVRA